MIDFAIYLDGKEPGNPRPDEITILRLLGWSRRKFFMKIEELQDAGVIFYRNEGRPPRKRICAFPSRIVKWVSLKSSKREVL